MQCFETTNEEGDCEFFYNIAEEVIFWIRVPVSEEGESNRRNLMLRLIFHGEIREFIVSASSSIEIGEWKWTNFLVQPGQERPSK